MKQIKNFKKILKKIYKIIHFLVIFIDFNTLTYTDFLFGFYYLNYSY